MDKVKMNVDKLKWPSDKIKLSPETMIWTKELKMRLRADGRLRVQPRITIATLSYLITGPGILKILRLICVLGAIVSFIIAPAHETYIAILLLEFCIVLSFIIIYVLGLHHLLICILWPAFDIMNCILTASFLLIVGIMVLWEEGSDEMIVSGSACCFTASGLCLIEVPCQGAIRWYKSWRGAIMEQLEIVRAMKQATSKTDEARELADKEMADVVLAATGEVEAMALKPDTIATSLTAASIEAAPSATKQEPEATKATSAT